MPGCFNLFSIARILPSSTRCADNAAIPFSYLLLALFPLLVLLALLASVSVALSSSFSFLRWLISFCRFASLSGLSLSAFAFRLCFSFHLSPLICLPAKFQAIFEATPCATSFSCMSLKALLNSLNVCPCCVSLICPGPRPWLTLCQASLSDIVFVHPIGISLVKYLLLLTNCITLFCCP